MSLSSSLFACMWIGGAALLAQEQAAPPVSPGLDLLTQVAHHYAQAKSYEMEWVVERTSQSALSRNWQKTVLTAAAAPGGNVHFEGHATSGSAEKISDGKTVWVYRVDAHRYTATPSGDVPRENSIRMYEFALSTAENERSSLAALAKGLKNADQLPDATVEVNGKKVLCSLVRVRSADQKRPSPGFSSEKTVWIDKGHLVVVKIEEHVHTVSVGEGAHIPYEDQVGTVFTKDELDGTPNTGLFTFQPPADAKLVAEFPDPFQDSFENLMTGSQAPISS